MRVNAAPGEHFRQRCTELDPDVPEVLAGTTTSAQADSITATSGLSGI